MMTCKDVLDLVEPIAAGDLVPDAALRAHVETCPRCAGELASARRLEAMLAGREAPAAPARFTALVLQRIRSERWRSEQQVDRLFNVAIAASLLLIAGGILALMNLTGVLAAATGTWTTAASLTGQLAENAAPTLNTYVAGICLLISALGMWWWAERTLSL
jgi:anti-sigma factor RsiW